MLPSPAHAAGHALGTALTRDAYRLGPDLHFQVHGNCALHFFTLPLFTKHPVSGLCNGALGQPYEEAGLGLSPLHRCGQ